MLPRHGPSLSLTPALRVPGYGDHLALTDPTIRERHAEPGVPAGFSDAIGWLEHTADADGAHWRVTFTVDDPDAVARRSEAAGGRIVVPTTDAPPVRFAVLADPGGAMFTVSSYRPDERSIVGADSPAVGTGTGGGHTRTAEPRPRPDARAGQ